MSALAWILHEQGHSVSGSDCRETARTRELRAAGISVHHGHDAAYLRDSEAVIYSSAIESENVELKMARELNLNILHRQQLLAMIYNSHSSIGIAGTHGKTTTSSMISLLLRRAGYDPTFLVGASSNSLGHYARSGKGRWLVSEVDESDGHFVHLHSDIAVITNVGEDHLNHYGSSEALLEGFKTFIKQSRRAVLFADDPHYELLASSARQSLSFGLKNQADLMAKNIRQDQMNTRADLVFQGASLGEIHLPAPGRHNIMNALTAMLAAHMAGIDFRKSMNILKSFSLPSRRFQILEDNGLVVVDDYAHLPEQVELNLEAIRQGWAPKRVIAVFQPHRYTRMSYMTEQFARALSSADLVLISDIYPAFERPIAGVHAEKVARLMRGNHQNVHYAGSLEETYSFLKSEANAGDFIIGFGAGDIWQVLHRLVRENGHAE
ncbi:UDP-N-acetylmuramate--L-alanine ligase [Candidatus Acetothermia bacterium]|nr:UDP-N-acetylmuramate--L-alanine ligase [Candidatus Acetothermia bacterium]